MATKLDILKLSSDKGQKRFIFTLSEISMPDLTLTHAPDGWNDFSIQWLRHKLYNSVLRKAAEMDLTFYKEGRDWLKTVYETNGIEADVTFTVHILDKTVYEYVTFPAPNKISFVKYMQDEVSVTVRLVDDGFKEKVFNREDTVVDILRNDSIEGQTLADISTEITIPDTSINISDTVTVLGGTISTPGTFIVPISAVTDSNFVEMQVPTGNIPDTKAASFFKSAVKGYILKLSGTIDFTIMGAVSVDFRIVQINNAENVIYNVGLHQDISIDTFDIDEQFIMSVGDSLIFECTFNGTSIITSGNFDVIEVYEGTKETEVKVHLDYEVFLKIAQIISDTANPLYSEFFGRTDTPLTTYPVDGELGAMTKGIYFRKGNITNETMPLTLKKYFEAKSAQFRLGLGVEYIDGQHKLRIESMDYFYNSDVILDISSLIRTQDIKIEAIPEGYFKALEFGYNKYAYDNESGTLEFNTKSNWTTIIQAVYTELKKICNYRADGQGMRLLLNAPYKDDYDSTKDVKGDDDIFLINLVKNMFTGYTARTNEGFSYVGGSVYADSSFNVYWSPARNLLRWGSVIKAGLMKKLNTFLKWQTCDKNNTLKSRLTTEFKPLVEQDDIRVNDLDNPKWLPEAMRVKVPLSYTQIQAIDNKPNGLIYLGPGINGWIIEAKHSIKDSMTELLLVRKYEI